MVKPKTQLVAQRVQEPVLKPQIVDGKRMLKRMLELKLKLQPVIRLERDRAKLATGFKLPDQPATWHEGNLDWGRIKAPGKAPRAK
jgi:hypothetical protein